MERETIRMTTPFLVWTTNQWHIYLKEENKKKKNVGKGIISLTFNTLNLKHL